MGVPPSRTLKRAPLGGFAFFGCSPPPLAGERRSGGQRWGPSQTWESHLPSPRLGPPKRQPEFPRGERRLPVQLGTPKNKPTPARPLRRCSAPRSARTGSGVLKDTPHPPSPTARKSTSATPASPHHLRKPACVDLKVELLSAGNLRQPHRPDPASMADVLDSAHGMALKGRAPFPYASDASTPC